MGLWMRMICAVLWLGIFPLASGLTVGIFTGEKRLSACMCSGVLMMGAVFEVCCVPMILLHQSLTRMLVLFHLSWAALAGVLVFAGFRTGKKADLKVLIPGRRKAFAEPAVSSWDRIYRAVLGILVAGLLAGQCAVYLFMMHIDDDDARYVANALAACETDTMYLYHPNTGSVMTYFMGEIGKEVVSPLMMLYAGISRILGVHPTIMAHSIWPVVWLLLSFCIYLCMAKDLFEGSAEKRRVFLLTVMTAHIFGNTSIYTGATFTLTRLWQGKALIPAVAVPAGLWILVRSWTGKREGRFLLLLFLNLFACLCSGMGIFLGAVQTVVICLILSVKERSFPVFIRGCLCCIPNGVFTVLYLLIQKRILV